MTKCTLCGKSFKISKRYLKARRPALYEAMTEPQESVTLPGWKMEHETDDRDAETG